MHYIKIKQEYLDFMQHKDQRIPNQAYGIGKYKPFYILSTLDGSDVLYATQLTSPKSRHIAMKENIDFKKIYHPNSGKLLGATNLNYMFPVLPEHIEHLSFSDLKKILRTDDKVRTLAIEKKVLDKMDLSRSCKDVYRLKYAKPESNLAKRCLDFKQLEADMVEYKLQEQFERDDITVERSNDHSTFFIHTPTEIYEYSQTILNDMYGFISDMNDNLVYEESLNTDLKSNDYLEI